MAGRTPCARIESRHMLRRVYRLFLFTILVAASSLLSAQSVPRSPMLVFLHVTVINPGSQAVEQDRAVVIRQDRITAVTSAAGFAAPEWALVVNARGNT